MCDAAGEEDVTTMDELAVFEGLNDGAYGVWPDAC